MTRKEEGRQGCGGHSNRKRKRKWSRKGVSAATF
jgi:hypothetical protein